MADTIETKSFGTVFSGRGAVEVFRLAAVIQMLRLETAGIKFGKGSALKASKHITGLRTNDRQKHIARLQVMLDEQKQKVQYING